MNYCKYCGKALDEGEVCSCKAAQAERAGKQRASAPEFGDPGRRAERQSQKFTTCPYCGKALAPGQKCTCEGAMAREAARAQVQKTRASFFKKKIFGIPFKLLLPGLVLLWLVFGCIHLFNNRTVTLDWQDYVSVTFQGIDSRGTALLNVDWDGMEDSVPSGRSRAFYGADVKLNLEENLSNGNTVQATLTYDPEEMRDYHIKVKKTTMEIEVEGLIPATPMDPFQEIEIQFLGVDGKGEVVITNNSSDPFVKTMKFTAEPEKNLKNGDTVSISVRYDREEADRRSVAIPDPVRGYEVTGLWGYVTSLAELDGEIRSQLDANCEKVLSAVVAKRARYWDGMNVMGDPFLVSAELVSEYLCSYADPMEPKSGVGTFRDFRSNFIFRIYRVEAEDEDGQAARYVSVAYPHILKDAQGNTSIDFEEDMAAGYLGYLSRKEADSPEVLYKECLAELQDKFIIRQD